MGIYDVAVIAFCAVAVLAILGRVIYKKITHKGGCCCDCRECTHCKKAK